MDFREPAEQDWARVLQIANESVSDVEGAGTQEEWLRNRQAFAQKGIQHHFVCTDSDQIVGYGSAEHASDAPMGEYRLFVVTALEKLAPIGEIILDELQSFLSKVQVGRSFFVEFANNFRLASFLQNYGYNEASRFTLESGAEVVVFDRKHNDFT